ncbi:hypothetical protein LSAT2_025562 [Lamellibrachia satsuma]|nr:hypothetical protein LSAT2_025562 [Lamellibrachia satsuma]
MVESGSTLYQIHTVATISPHGQVFENPAVQACGCNDVVCVAADSQVLLFQEECRKFLFSVGLDSLVDCVACNEQGDFLAVGDRGGGLHFMATAFQHTLISQQLIETNKLTSREQVTFTHIVFTAMSDEGACDLLVLAACGQVYHFQNLQLRQLKQALVSKDVVTLRDLQKDIRVDMFDAMFAHSETTLYVHCLPPSVGSSILTAVSMSVDSDS